MKKEIENLRVKIRLQEILILFLLLVPGILNAQRDSIKYNIELLGELSTGTYAPFWLQSNQYGKISEQPDNGGILLGVEKKMNKPGNLFDYGFKANLYISSYKNTTNINYHELYLKARLLVFNLNIGAKEEIIGNQDSSLSSGGLLFSKNSRPMPKITIGIEQFTPVPYTKGYLEIKGALSHGWFTDNIYSQNLLLHHKYLYLKIGGKLPIHIQYGIDHVAQWGGTVPVYGKQPSDLSAFKSIFLGGAGGADATMNDQLNALGNHIISQSMRLDANVNDFRLAAYWQNLNEDGPIRVIWNSMNLPDGLWGISIRNNNCRYISGIVFEYLNTTDQTGPFHDKDGIIYGGNDSYFMNGIYRNGWNYYMRTIGTPFITSPVYNNNVIYTLNNRVQVHHIGIEGNISGYNYKFLSSFSKNYGSYSNPFTTMKPNTSLLLDVNRNFPKLWNTNVDCSLGADIGQLYGNSAGILISIKKTGDLFNF